MAQGTIKRTFDTKTSTSIFTPSSGIEVKTQYAYVQGNMAYINLRLYRSTAFTSRTTVGTFSEGFRPKTMVCRGVAAMASTYDNQLNGNCEFFNATNGALTLDINSYNTGKEVNIVCTYPV